MNNFTFEELLQHLIFVSLEILSLEHLLGFFGRLHMADEFGKKIVQIVGDMEKNEKFVDEEEFQG